MVDTFCDIRPRYWSTGATEVQEKNIQTDIYEVYKWWTKVRLTCLYVTLFYM